MIDAQRAETTTKRMIGDVSKGQNEVKEEKESINQSQSTTNINISAETFHEDFTERNKQNGKYFTIDLFITEQKTFYNRKVGLIIDLCNHACLYATDLEKYKMNSIEAKKSLENCELIDSKDEKKDPVRDDSRTDQG